MPEETISITEFASALGLDPKASKAEVLNALAVLRVTAGAEPRRKRKLSAVFKDVAEYDSLKKQSVKVRVIAPHPLFERGEVYSAPVLDPNGRVKTPGDVFVTDKARLRKLAPFVEEVPGNTPTTKEAAKAAASEKKAA